MYDPPGRRGMVDAVEINEKHLPPYYPLRRKHRPKCVILAPRTRSLGNLALPISLRVRLQAVTLNETRVLSFKTMGILHRP